MPIVKESDGTTAALTLTVETTLRDIATLGSFVLEVNLANMVDGEEVEIIVYNKVLAGDAYAVAWRETFKHAQDQLIVQSEPVRALNGIKCTITQTGGVGRTYKWNLIQIDADSVVASIFALLDTEIAAIKAKTDNLPVDPADASDIAAAFAITNAFIDTEVAAILAAVDTEVGAIKAKTDNLPINPASQTNLDVAVSTRAAPGAAMTLTVGERDAAAAALLDLAAAIEAGLTVRQLLRLVGATLAGKVSGAGSGTEVFRNAVADSKDRVTATVDASGNRTAIVTDVT